jgi:hypothetical protein
MDDLGLHSGSRRRGNRVSDSYISHNNSPEKNRQRVKWVDALLSVEESYAVETDFSRRIIIKKFCVSLTNFYCHMPHDKSKRNT